MFKNFKEIETCVLSNKTAKRIALAGSHDSDSLSAVVNARRTGAANSILIGDQKKTLLLLSDLGEQAGHYTFIDEPDEAAAAALACRLVKEGQAEIPMKGLMHTSTFMRAILNKAQGLVPEKGLLSQVTVLEYEQKGRLILASDCAVNISPAYEDKVKILKNAVALAQKLHNTRPLVAVVTPVEVVNPAIQSTIDAAMLSKAAERGQLGNCMVDGPLALDNAVFPEAAKHKGIESSVAGRADILIMPDLNAGNIFSKSLTYFGRIKSAGCLCGATSPIIMTSRSDPPQNKYLSILTAIITA